MAANMVVRTNTIAINAHRNIKNTGIGQSRAAQRLASGYRINSAADDAAGLAISETMRAQIRGLDQAERNSQDGIALIQTAEGGMNEITNMIQRMRELVVQAANDTNTLTNREQIQLEIDQLTEEINQMARRVEFNTRELLTGNYARGGAVSFAVTFETTTPANVTSVNIAPDATVIVNASDLVPGFAHPSGYWSFSTAGVLTIHSASSGQTVQINGSGMVNLDRIEVQDGTNANIILNNVNISTNTGAALDMRSAIVNLWLADGSVNNMATSVSSSITVVKS